MCGLTATGMVPCCRYLFGQVPQASQPVIYHGVAGAAGGKKSGDKRDSFVAVFDSYRLSRSLKK